MVTETEIRTAVRLTPVEARAALDMALTFADTRANGYERLRLVRVYNVDGRARFEATDSHRLIRVEMDRPQGDAFDVSIPPYIVKDAIKLIAGHVKGSQLANVEISGDRIAVVHPDTGAPLASLTFEPVEVSHPDFDPLIPPRVNEGGSYVGINGRFLADAGSLAAKYGSHALIRFQAGESPKHPIRADWSGDGFTAVSVLMPLFVDC